MHIEFEELAFAPTSMGELTLRRRTDPLLKKIVFEVKLGDEFLMSSLFTVGERALADRGLERYAGKQVDVVVGGLGLGFTAAAVLEHERVESLLVIDALPDVIEWHRRSLVPLGATLTADPRCRLQCDDFFQRARSAESGFDAQCAARRFDVVLLDIDHSPRHVLHPDHASFYELDGLQQLSSQMTPGGVFAMWSNDPPDAVFSSTLCRVFDRLETEVVEFDNPYTGGVSACTLYIAETRRS